MHRSQEESVNTRELAGTRIGRRFVGLLGRAMESSLRYRFFGPTEILNGVENLCRGTVLEIGCGTGYFTIPAARFIGDHGSLVAIDILPEAVDFVSNKIQAAGVKNVQVLQEDALAMTFKDACFDTVLLLGVIPAPMLPLNALLTEVYRVLKTDGILTVWPPIPGYLPRTIVRTGLFSYTSKRKGVYNFRRSSAEPF
jgi:SAM-dependent methyltransferase